MAEKNNRNAITLLHHQYMRVVLVALKEGVEMRPERH